MVVYEEEDNDTRYRGSFTWTILMLPQDKNRLNDKRNFSINFY